MENMPKDPVMLLSFVNMKLRDFYKSLEELADDFQCKPTEIQEKLAVIDYEYDRTTNQFV